MARLVYACRFDVRADEGLSIVLSSYRDWIVQHYRSRRQIADFDFDLEADGTCDHIIEHHSLSSSVYQDGEGRVIRIRWSFPDDNDNGLRWANEVRIGQFGDRCGVEHLIYIESVEYSVSPAKLLFGSPRAVRDICRKTPAYIGEMQVRAEPYKLEHGGVADLLALLTSDLRRLPIILLSSYARGDVNQIDATKLAQNLAGVAVVVQIIDPELTWDFADEVGRQLSCFNGGARIYWPGFTKISEPKSHRLYFGTWIEDVGPIVAARAIERAVFAVAAFRFVPDGQIVNLIRSVEAAERRKVLVEKKETGDDFWADYERDLALLNNAEKRLEELEAENANLRANQQIFFVPEIEGTGNQAPVEASELSFSSVIEAVQAAAGRCKNLEFLDSAMSAAEDCPFQRPYDIFQALTDLNVIVDAWKDNRDRKGSGGDLLLHLRDRGWGKRSSMHISDTTRSKYRSAYEFDYQDAKQLFEPHITLGSGDANSCASIHFIFDPERLKMIVGHVGKHLPNTKT